MKSYFAEHVKNDESYDDIYPSIVKQQPSHFKRYFYIYLLVLNEFGTEYAIQRSLEVACSNRALTSLSKFK